MGPCVLLSTTRLGQVVGVLRDDPGDVAVWKYWIETLYLFPVLMGLDEKIPPESRAIPLAFRSGNRHRAVHSADRHFYLPGLGSRRSQT